MVNPVWERIFASRGWGRYPAEDLIRFVMHESRGRAYLKALEIGCGPGANLCFLAEQGISFDAIDGSKTAVMQAEGRLNIEHLGWQGRIVLGDFCQLPADFTGYDFALDSQALSCVGFDEARKAIEQIYDRLNYGGALFSRTFANGTWDGAIKDMDVRVSTPEQVEQLFGKRWSSVAIGEITRHEGNRNEMVREWLVTARK